MTQEFSNLSIILARCGEKIANQALEEIKAAVNQAVAQAATPAEVDTAFAPLSTTITTAKATRAAKAAARRAAKKAQELAEPAQQAPADTRCESCGEAEAEQPAAAPDTYLTPAMVQYLRRCPDDYLLQVLTTYIHLLRTGNLIFLADDRRYINNFLLLARSAGIIAHPDAPITPDEITNYFLNNPALPIPRAQRRALERAQRRALRHSQK
ncbi:MAG: hypothetical protein ACI4AM_09585 [Muribaculaceae bacterium]